MRAGLQKTNTEVDHKLRKDLKELLQKLFLYESPLATAEEAVFE